jgi:predicted DNA-binding transcriptional regulator YafY
VAQILLPVSFDEAARMIPRTVAMLESQEGGTVVEIGSSSLERMVGYLAGLRPACQVLDPPELRQALADHAHRIAAANVSGS